MFEGAQGVLLDEWHGFHPYTTWSTTTFANAETLLAEAGMAGAAQRLGVLRTTTTRHGPGPLVTEDAVYQLAPAATAWKRVTAAVPGLTYVHTGAAIYAHGDGISARGVFVLDL